MDRVSSPISAVVCNCMVGLLSPLLSKACSSAVALFYSLKGTRQGSNGMRFELAGGQKKEVFWPGRELSKRELAVDRARQDRQL